LRVGDVPTDVFQELRSRMAAKGAATTLQSITEAWDAIGRPRSVQDIR
jgi:hypothetical protein